MGYKSDIFGKIGDVGNQTFRKKKKKEIKHLKKYEEVNINHSSNIQR